MKPSQQDQPNPRGDPWPAALPPPRRDRWFLGSPLALLLFLILFFPLDAPAPYFSKLGDFVWKDQNHNGIQDVGEPGINKVTVNLYQCGGEVPIRSTTANGGAYLFDYLAAGSYQVEFVAPTGYVFSPKDQGSNDALDSDADPTTGKTACVTLETNETNNLTVDAGLYLSPLGDRVWEDKNGNGIQDQGEPNVDGATVELYEKVGSVCGDGDETLVNSQTTPGTPSIEGGNYLFSNLTPGDYCVKFTAPHICNGMPAAFTAQNVGSNTALDSNANPTGPLTGWTAPITLAGQTNLTIDAGVYCPAALGDFVWEDTNRNGVQDNGESGVAGVPVALLQCVTNPDGTISQVATGKTTQTAGGGLYGFSDLMPGSYAVQFDLTGFPTYEFTTAKAGGDDVIDSDAESLSGDGRIGATACRPLQSGQTDDDIDAGIRLIQGSKLGDYVWEDKNADGLQNDGATGIAGVSVELLTCVGDVKTPTGQFKSTDANGLYLFEGLAAGRYAVRFTRPTGYTETSPPNAGSDDAIDSDADPATGETSCVDLGVNDTNLTLDAGYYNLAKLGNFVWNDQNRDGLQTTGEPGVDNVTVKLYACNATTGAIIGDVLSTQTTSGGGLYQFTDLLPGYYKVQFVNPAGYEFTEQYDGTGNPNNANLAIDSNADANGFTECLLLPSGGDNQTIDAGLVAPPAPAIDLTKFVNDDDANSLTGPVVSVGSTVTFKFVVKNTGNVTLAPVTVTDNVYGNICDITSLEPGASLTCTKTATAVAGQHTNTGTATGTPPPGVTPSPVTDTDPGNYFGATPAIDLTKFVNDDDANSPTGPEVSVGSTVTFKFVVKNTGNVTLAPVTVTDDVYGAICTIASLAPSASQTCEKTATAGAGQHTNTGTATGTPPSGPPVIDRDPGNYFGESCTGSIGDFVWEDTNRNGIQDNGEPGIPDVTVELRGSADNLLSTTTTNASGLYQFTDLCLGTYRVVVTTPVDYTPTTSNAPSSTSANDSNGSPATVTLPANNSSDQTIDFGFVKSACDLTVEKTCLVPVPPPTGFVCSDAKPITSMVVKWNGSQTIYVRMWNGSVGTGTPTSVGPIAPGQNVTFTRTTASTPNDIYFQIYTDAGYMQLLGTSTFHLSCSDVDMDGPEDCGKASGNGKTTSTSFINTWLFDGMGGNGKVLSCTSTPPTPSEACTLEPTGNPGCATLGKPINSLTFKYVPAPCATNNNPQSGKYTCSGSTPSGSVTVTSSNTGLKFSQSLVAPGEEFTVSGSFGADTRFTIGTQTLNIHTSCSQVLEVGNVFASMQLVAYNDQTGGSAVTYGYKVINNGDLLSNVSLVDDKLGTIGSGFSLAKGESKTFTKVATLTETTTNVATATVTLADGQSCSATDSVKVTVGTVKPCNVTAGTPTVDKKTFNWPITNGGSSRVTLNQITVTWPASNGYLSKAKFDGDVIWDGTINCVAGTCSAIITGAQLTTDDKKKRIDPGKTRKFVLEFQNNASATLTDYSVGLSFGTGCEVTYGQPPVSCKGAIGDFVWNDLNQNGVQDDDEPGIPGVSVALTQNGVVRQTAITTEDGRYEFDGLCANTYGVTVATPFGYTPTTPGAGTTETDSNLNPSPVTLPTDDSEDMTVDFGFSSIGGVALCPSLTTPIAGFGPDNPVGLLFVTDKGNTVTVRYLQNTGLNDNSYGTNQVGWGANAPSGSNHTFGNLTGSDSAQFTFFNAGTKVLDFEIDYLSAKSGTPSGFGTLGVSGGDGGMKTGSASNVFSAMTSLDVNLNSTGYCVAGNCAGGGTDLKVNSPPTTSPTSYTLPAGSPYREWQFPIWYEVTVSKALLTGSWRVQMGTVHNSPPKAGSNAVIPIPCP